MKTYWDLSEPERAALTRDDVAKFIDAELMLKGVLAVAPLTLADETPPVLATEPYYRVGDEYTALDVAFRSEADARAFLGLGPVRVTTEWSLGSDNRFVEPIRPDTVLRLVQLPSRSAVEIAAVSLKEAQAAKSENERRRRDHADATKKVEETLKGLWDDWHACTAKGDRMRAVTETYAKYLALADGNAVTAGKFLVTAFGLAAVQDAEEWTGTKMLPIEAPAMPVEAVS